MYNINRLNEVKSYASEATALKAITKAFGAEDGGPRHCNILLARNAAGRVVPICCNINPDNNMRALVSGFLCVN